MTDIGWDRGTDHGPQNLRHDVDVHVATMSGYSCAPLTAVAVLRFVRRALHELFG